MNKKEFTKDGYYLAKWKGNIYFAKIIHIPVTMDAYFWEKFEKRSILATCLSSFYFPDFIPIKDCSFICLEPLLEQYQQVLYKSDFRELIKRWYSYAENMNISSININDYVKILDNYLKELSEMEG